MGDKPELDIAARKLAHDWSGGARRVKYPGRRDFPDYILTNNGRVAFVELKAVASPRVIIKATRGQLEELEALAREGLTAGLLTLVGGDWWVLYRPPFRNKKLYADDAIETSMRATPALIFAGP